MVAELSRRSPRYDLDVARKRPIRPRRILIDGVEHGICTDEGCNGTFPIQVNRRGQTTSRQLCDDCREKGNRRLSAELAVPAGTPRCSECQVVADLRFSAATLRDGVCMDCRKWAAKMAARTRPNSYAPVSLSWPRKSEKPLGDTPAVKVDAQNVARLCEAEEPPIDPMAVLQQAINAIAAEYRCTPEEITGPGRMEELPALRFGIWRALRAVGWPLQAIAEATGRASYTSVVTGLRHNAPTTLAAEAIAARYVLPLGDQPRHFGLGGNRAILSHEALADYVRLHGGVVADYREIARHWRITPKHVGKRLRRIGLRYDQATGAYRRPAEPKRWQVA